MEKNIKHGELSRKIIGAAMAVLNELKPGQDEKIYENSLVVELTGQNIRIDQQKQFPVLYKGHLVGTLIPDLIVGSAIIVDTKVVTTFNDAHISQMIGYLAITGLDVGLILNFKYPTLQWKRILRPDPDHGSSMEQQPPSFL